nr:SH3 domain-containing protein [Roseovarius aestuariivivens]
MSTAPIERYNRAEVVGVEEPDMLKMRAGPGTGYDIKVGLPNGTILRVENCSRIGGTRWCEVALDRRPGLRGYVSETYLRPL